MSDIDESSRLLIITGTETGTFVAFNASGNLSWTSVSQPRATLGPSPVPVPF
jgi:hypothetical protein